MELCRVLLAGVAHQEVHRVHRDEVVAGGGGDRVGAEVAHQASPFEARPPKPKPRRAGAGTAGAASGTAETAEACSGVTGLAAPKPRFWPSPMPSDLLTRTVD